MQPKFAAEIAEMQKMKAAETKDPKAKIKIWDWRYYNNQLNKQKYTVDKEALRAYFPFQKVLDGMFAIYQNIFGLKFEQITAPYKWVDDLQLYMVTRFGHWRATGHVLSRHVSARRKIQSLRAVQHHRRQTSPKREISAAHSARLLCNFPPPSADKPSLMTHTDVETLFHEFGHALHSIVTRAKYQRFCRLECAGRFRRSAFADAAELGLGQNRARYFRGRLS